MLKWAEMNENACLFFRRGLRISFGDGGGRGARKMALVWNIIQVLLELLNEMQDSPIRAPAQYMNCTRHKRSIKLFYSLMVCNYVLTSAKSFIGHM